MRIGIVSYWFNRGQATVARQIRSIFDNSGHETFVLARPTMESFVLPGFVSESDVWQQPRVSAASEYNISEKEYMTWAKKNNLDIIFFDQNYQFDAIKRLKAEGLKTIGRFVWESFSHEHADPARKAFSIIYSLTRCEQKRYRTMGISSPYVQWGCFPDVVGYRKDRENLGKTFLYIGGFLSNRKPTGAVIETFKNVQDPTLRLVLKTQRDIRESDMVIPQSLVDVKLARKGEIKPGRGFADDKRIEVFNSDVTSGQYLELFSESDVSLAPSRWEGLGLHLYEALALGVPTISCDIPPINEVITDNVDGILVGCHPIGMTPSGITAYEPDLGELRNAIKKMSQPGVAQSFRENILETIKTFSWDRTAVDYEALLHA